MRPVLKALSIALALAVVLLASAILWLLLPTVANPESGFTDRKGRLAESREIGSRTLAGGHITEIALESSSGLQVKLALRVPEELLPGRPLVLLIAGQESGREAVEMIDDTHGVMVAALSYLYRGSSEFSRLGLALDLHKVQGAILDTPPAVMLALDYLLREAAIEPGSIELAGVSFGAFLASVPAALDPRIERLWLIHGAGDPAAVLAKGLSKHVPLRPLRKLLGRFLAAAAVSHHLGPELWVGQVSPRPVVVINARDDSDLPAEAVQALHDALGEPSTVMWTRGGHVHPKRRETVNEIVDLMFSKVAAETRQQR